LEGTEGSGLANVLSYEPPPKGRIAEEMNNLKDLRSNSQYKLSVGIILEDLY
jgi:hypothetical protein